MIGQPGWFIVLGESVLTILGLQRIDVYRSVGRLSRNVLVEGIPGDALYIVTVLGYLTNESSYDRRLDHGQVVGHRVPTCACVINPGDIVHTPDDEVMAIGGPGQVIYLRSARATHMFCPPAFFIVLAVGSECWRDRFAGNPEDDVAIVAGGREKLACLVEECQWMLRTSRYARTATMYLLETTSRR